MNTTNLPNSETDLQSVIDWMGFTTADAKYQALVAASQQQDWQLTDSISH